MQTFLPYADYEKSAKVLDFRRLGKQRLEAYQIYSTITQNRTAWAKHPAVKMWGGYELALAYYYNTIREEWVKRGYNNTMPEIVIGCRQIQNPFWFGDERLHASHRSNLLRKDRECYSQFGWTEPDDLPYFWPV